MHKNAVMLKENLYYHHSHEYYDQLSMSQIMELFRRCEKLKYLPYGFSQKDLQKDPVQKEKRYSQI